MKSNKERTDVVKTEPAIEKVEEEDEKNSSTDGSSFSGDSSARAAVVTSIMVFRKFIERDSDGTLNALKVLSKECYDEWMAQCRTQANSPEKAFRRALSAHVTGVDGRTPFVPEEEEAVLRVLRRKKIWECFTHTPLTIGKTGYRSKGFHEKRAPFDAEEDHSSEKKPKISGSEAEEEDLDKVATSKPEQTLLATIDDDPEAIQMDNINAESAAIFADVTELWRSSKDFDEVYEAIKVSMMKVLNRYEDHWWPVSHAFFRLIVIGVGLHNRPTQADADKAMRDLVQLHPKDYIILLDQMSNNCFTRVMAQNEISVDYFGSIEQSRGGMKRARFHASDFWAALKSFLLAFFRPDQDAELIWRLRFFNDNFHMCKSFLRFDPATGLLIERGCLIDPKF